MPKTKNNIKCTDGRIIHKDAFKDNDGGTVPLVWEHLHNEPSNILGHALLENREDAFKDNDGGTVPLVWEHLHNELSNILGHALLVQNGDITHLSIYANNLRNKNLNPTPEQNNIGVTSSKK